MRAGPRQRRILVVDDNADLAESLAMMLAMHAYDVRTACNGREGVDIAIDWTPDAVLLDLNMPVMDGFEAARQLRSVFERPFVIVALTSQPADSEAEYRSAGFDRYLLKTIDPVRIATVLDDAMAEAEQRQR